MSISKHNEAIEPLVPSAPEYQPQTNLIQSAESISLFFTFG